MRIETRHNPAFGVARLMLEGGESINGEAGAMYQHSANVQIESRMQGGIGGALKRKLSGESAFVSEFTAPQEGGWVDVAPVLSGTVYADTVEEGRAMIITRGSWLASDKSVALDTKFGNTSTIFGGEGLFVIRASGSGQLVLAAYGAVDVHDLNPGEGLTIDTGHLVSYDETMPTRIRKAAVGMMSTLKSGEGLVMDIQGPGRVVTQSRNPSAFTSWIASLLPSNNNNSSSGFNLGSVLGN
jgi:uncharacterized protein (TIGR00266 family)